MDISVEMEHVLVAVLQNVATTLFDVMMEVTNTDVMVNIISLYS